jgi:hypothetical protein
MNPPLYNEYILIKNYKKTGESGQRGPYVSRPKVDIWNAYTAMQLTEMKKV